jgi:hypothetical protein
MKDSTKIRKLATKFIKKFKYIEEVAKEVYTTKNKSK